LRCSEVFTRTVQQWAHLPYHSPDAPLFSVRRALNYWAARWRSGRVPPPGTPERVGHPRSAPGTPGGGSRTPSGGGVRTPPSRGVPGGPNGGPPPGGSGRGGRSPHCDPPPGSPPPPGGSKMPFLGGIWSCLFWLVFSPSFSLALALFFV